MKSTLISTIMTKDLECVSPSQKLVDVKHIYEKRKFHHHIPVVDNAKLVGMVSLIDFMRSIGDANLDDSHPAYNDLIVNDIMTENPDTLNINATIEDAALILSKGNYHAMPIVENSKLVGIVSTADVIKFFVNN